MSTRGAEPLESRVEIALKIEFDGIAAFTYPLNKADVQRMLPLVGENIASRIAHIRFGCNQKTTQEGRTVQRGPQFDIRINFCVKSGVGLLLSRDPSYMKIITLCGGEIDPGNNQTVWTPAAAKRYAAFLLLHEIAHIVYCTINSGGEMTGKRTGANEEKWCDQFALRLLPRTAL